MVGGRGVWHSKQLHSCWCVAMHGAAVAVRQLLLPDGAVWHIHFILGSVLGEAATEQVRGWPAPQRSAQGRDAKGRGRLRGCERPQGTGRWPEPCARGGMGEAGQVTPETGQAIHIEAAEPRPALMIGCRCFASRCYQRAVQAASGGRARGRCGVPASRLRARKHAQTRVSRGMAVAWVLKRACSKCGAV